VKKGKSALGNLETFAPAAMKALVPMESWILLILANSRRSSIRSLPKRQSAMSVNQSWN